MDDEMEFESELEQMPLPAPIFTQTGQVIWVPQRHHALLQEWDWYFDPILITAFRMDDEHGRVDIADQMSTNIVIRGEAGVKGFATLSPYQLFLQFGECDEYAPFIRESTKVRVLLSRGMDVDMCDGHLLLGALYCSVNMEYLRWFAAGNYLVQNEQGPTRVPIAPRYETLGAWASNACYEADGKTHFIRDMLNYKIVAMWKEGLNFPSDAVTVKQCEAYLSSKGSSAGTLLSMALAMIYTAPPPPLVS